MCARPLPTSRLQLTDRGIFSLSYNIIIRTPIDSDDLYILQSFPAASAVSREGSDSLQYCWLSFSVQEIEEINGGTWWWNLSAHHTGESFHPQRTTCLHDWWLMTVSTGSHTTVDVDRLHRVVFCWVSGWLTSNSMVVKRRVTYHAECRHLCKGTVIHSRL